LTRDAPKRRYYLRRALAAQAQRISSRFPAWKTLSEIATRLAFVRSVYGPYLLNTPGDRTFELCVGGYGPFVAEAIASQARRFTFLDIGANLGLFSLLAARHPQCDRVIAVEPLPDIYRSLEANIRRNGADKIQPILGAVSATPERSVHLSFDARHSGMSRIVESRSGAVRAPVISAAMLDSLFSGSPGAIVIKIDVEGSESDVLSTLRSTRFYGAIAEAIVEVSEQHGGMVRRDQLLHMLAQEGFEEVSRSGAPSHYDARYRRTRLPRA
jgi:FkbM family methyltransferase